AAPEDLCIRVHATNRGPDAATLRLLPTLWFRNVWSWYDEAIKPNLRAEGGVVRVSGSEAGAFRLHCDGAPALLFTENETNQAALDGGENASPYTKDAFHRYVVHGEQGAVHPDRTGTKMAADYALELGPGETGTIRLRLVHGETAEPFGAGFDAIVAARRAEADDFYALVMPETLDADARAVMRQSLAGMLWTKQYYEYDVARWKSESESGRNADWEHLRAHDILSMPDKWEYPWFAVWDSAFHCLPLMVVDVDFVKEQLSLFLEDRYLHPHGQIPAYEWNFDDVNPPVHAWATFSVYAFDKERRNGEGDFTFLRDAFERLERNFQWWCEHKGPDGATVFEGGFLGLDNIGVFDRSRELPTGGRLEQSDGTAWMAFYAQSMLTIAIELACEDGQYEEKVVAYLDHFLRIATAMDRIGEHDDEMWDEADGFFYDILRFPDGQATRLKVRSLVGLLPLAAVTVFEQNTLDCLPRLKDRLDAVVAGKGDAIRNIHCPTTPGLHGRGMLAVMDEQKLRRVLGRMLDENEFLGPYGIRSLSRHHAQHPYSFHWGDETFTVAYLPGESDSGMFGGNSNWRGPVWWPANVLLLRALIGYYAYYGDSFRVECPTGSGRECTLYEVASEVVNRLGSIFVRDENGRRPVFGGAEKFQADPHWRDHILFYEYFHGDDGAGLGASHQTGWTGCFAWLAAVFGVVDAQAVKRLGPKQIAGPVADATNAIRKENR
ncbi:MAG: glucosidase, partial [Planctomycetota bacterium]